MLVIYTGKGVTLEVNLRECILCMPLPSANKASHSLKPRGDFSKSPKQGYQWPQKWTCVHWNLKKTRMHSSRMRTVRCSGRLSCHACPLPATHAPTAMHVSLPCMTPPHTPPATYAPLPCIPPLPHMPPPPHMPPCHAHPPGQNSWHTLVKTLPFRNYCCGR